MNKQRVKELKLLSETNPGALSSDLSECIKEIEELQAELIEMYTNILSALGSISVIDDEEWICSNASSDVNYAANKLVELGIMKKHPTCGIGRVQYYRNV